MVAEATGELTLMKRNHCLVVMLLLSWSLGDCGVVAREGAEPSRAVTLTVTVLDPNGERVPEFAVGVRPAWGDVRSTQVDALSDAEGEALVQIEVPTSTQELHVSLGARLEAPTIPSRATIDIQRFRELKRQFTIRRLYTVEVLVNQSVYSLQIQLAPAVTVRGRLVTPTGEPVNKGAVSARGCECNAWTGRDEPGVFVLDSVPRNEAVEVVLSGNSQATRLIALTASQTQSDLDLGDIVLPPKAGACKVRLAFTSDRPGGARGSLLQTVVSSDGRYIVSVMAGADGELVDPALREGWLPPGQYYVFPGSPHVNDTWFQLFDLIRAGRADDHPELPSFVASATEEVSITIDPKETVRKIRAAAETEAITQNP